MRTVLALGAAESLVLAEAALAAPRSGRVLALVPEEQAAPLEQAVKNAAREAWRARPRGQAVERAAAAIAAAAEKRRRRNEKRRALQR